MTYIISSAWFSLLLLHLPPILLVETLRVNVSINIKDYRHQSRDDFLSFALDCALIPHNWFNFNTSNPSVITMVQGLAPAVLRLGGTKCDRVIFDDATNQPTAFEHQDDMSQRTILKSTDWDKLVQLTRATNLTLLFDANVMLRDSLNQWNPSNFINFLNYNQRMGYSNIMFELGNEPNRFPIVFNKTITASQLAADFSVLKQIVRSYPFFKDSLIVGADTSGPYLLNELGLDPAFYIHDFFKAGHSNINAFTWHQYYFDGSTAKVSDFINPNIMDKFPKQVLRVDKIIHKVLGPDRTFPVWMGETSSAYDSGAPGMSNSFVSGFLWMDKLGVAARSGYDVVIRQTLYGGWNCLIDKNLIPNPDYYLSLLFKHLVGTRTLRLTVSSKTSSVRAYSACARSQEGVVAGDVVVYAMNLDKNTTVSILPDIHYSSVLSYNMEPTDGTLTSSHVNINGKTMRLVNNKLPVIVPHKVNIITLKPLTFGFFILTDAKAAACL